ncbi:MAG: EamA family transporter RarD [Deltaproteobacteria bacterium]|nr:EamA family transporter RarD [Deltaproteobacteria bacterium]
MKKGILLAIGAYGLWGVFPIYWKQLQQVPATEIIGHRIVWSLVFASGVVVCKKRLMVMLQTMRDPRMVLIYGVAAAVLAVNWTTYVWGINAGYVVEASLGYFINPLVSVLLGVLFFRERLRPLQWTAIALAALGVAYLTIRYGSLPWIALVLAFSFGTYGLIKKSAPLEALEGLSLELCLLFVPAMLYLMYLESKGAGTFGHVGFSSILLALGGIVTATPLLMFAGAARRSPLSMVGILQYIAPTLQFSIGVWIYGEEFSRVRFTGFCFIWAALVIYTMEGLYAHRRKERALSE